MIGRETVQFQQSPESRFSSTFRNSNHFQTGIKVGVQKGFAHVVAPYHKEITLGSLVFPQIDLAKHVEVFVLKSGTK